MSQNRGVDQTLPNEISRVERQIWEDGSISENYKNFGLDIYLLCQYLIALGEIKINAELNDILSKSLKKLIRTYEKKLLLEERSLYEFISGSNNFLSSRIIGHLLNSYCSSEKDKAEYQHIISTIENNIMSEIQSYKMQEELDLINQMSHISEMELINLLLDIRKKSQSDKTAISDNLFSDYFVEQKIANGSINLIEHYTGTIKHGDPHKARKALEKLNSCIEETNPFRKRLRNAIQHILNEVKNSN